MLNNISSIVSFEEFERLYKIFEEPPYNEKFTQAEVKEIYDELISLGHINGYYIDNELVGCIGYRKMIENEHPVHYEHPEDVAYFAEIIVLSDFRGRGIGTSMIKYMLNCLKHEGYSKVYMRTLQQGQSMSYGIAVKCGFTLMENVVQAVKGPRTVEERDEVDVRIFLEREL